jgi:hypothetical protein
MTENYEMENKLPPKIDKMSGIDDQPVTLCLFRQAGLATFAPNENKDLKEE